LTEKQTSEAVFSILDPRGIMPEWDVIPLTAPRLDTLEGKTVYVYSFEGFAQLMPEIERLLPEFAPGVKTVFWDNNVGKSESKSGQGPVMVGGTLSSSEILGGEVIKEIRENADAVIVGNGF